MAGPGRRLRSSQTPIPKGYVVGNVDGGNQQLIKISDLVGGLPAGAGSAVVASPGNVTTSVTLTSGKIVTGNGAADVIVDADASLSAGALTLGTNASVLGSVKMFGSTSGDVTVKPAAVAGTATNFRLPSTNGTNNYVLITDGSGNTSWANVASGGISVVSLVSTLTASSSASLAWTGLTGKHWRLEGRLLRPATSGAVLYIRFGTGAGPTYATTGYYSGGVRAGLTIAEGPTQVSSTNSAGFQNTVAQDNTQVGATFHFDITTDNASIIEIMGSLNTTSSADGHTRTTTLSGIANVAAQVTAIQILESSGNITQGEASLYAIST